MKRDMGRNKGWWVNGQAWCCLMSSCVGGNMGLVALGCVFFTIPTYKELPN